MNTNIMRCYDDYLDKVVEYDFTKTRKSNYNSKIYYQFCFVRVGLLGEEPARWKEFGIGQTLGGYYGYYRAYIYIPSYWKISTYSSKEIARKIDIYGDSIVYKRINGPDGTSFEKHNCIGWSYDHGLNGEKNIGKEDVARDISQVIKEIVDWEWDNEPDLMTRSAINEAYSALDSLRLGIKSEKMSNENYKDVEFLFEDMEKFINTRRNEHPEMRM